MKAGWPHHLCLLAEDMANLAAGAGVAPAGIACRQH